MVNVGDFFEVLGPYLLDLLITLLVAFAYYYIGFKIIDKVGQLIDHALERTENIDPTLASFARSLAVNAMKFFLFIVIMGQLGIENTQFVALGAAVFLALALAMEDSLTNFASGLMMLMLKPIKVGDAIEAADTEGDVERIELFNTMVQDDNGALILIPNSEVMGGPLLNQSRLGRYRVDVKIPIAPKADFKLAKELIMQIMDENEMVLKDPPPRVIVETWDRYHTMLVAWAWCDPGDDDDVFAAISEAAKDALDQAMLLEFEHDSDLDETDSDDESFCVTDKPSKVLQHGARGLARQAEKKGHMKHGMGAITKKRMEHLQLQETVNVNNVMQGDTQSFGALLAAAGAAEAADADGD